MSKALDFEAIEKAKGRAHVLKVPSTRGGRGVTACMVGDRLTDMASEQTTMLGLLTALKSLWRFVVGGHMGLHRGAFAWVCVLIHHALISFYLSGNGKEKKALSMKF